MVNGIEGLEGVKITLKVSQNKHELSDNLISMCHEHNGCADNIAETLVHITLIDTIFFNISNNIHALSAVTYSVYMRCSPPYI